MSFDEFLVRFRAKHPEWFGTGAVPAAPKGQVQAVHIPVAPVAAVRVDIDDGWDGVEVEQEEPSAWWEK